ncbi:MAG: hypothetical protein L0271_04570 [Gemmatimonadetes bacterium]|nr:hypothetical protein [Gemmatimonadota bacterium]
MSASGTVAAIDGTSGNDRWTARIEAPGRVNLMGDHIDYHGLDVLPIALAQRVRMQVRVRVDTRVRVRNADRAFRDCGFDASERIQPGPAGDWCNYCRAAVAGLLKHDGTPPCGFDAWVESDVPIAAGLSSSSALVVATGLAWLHANRQTLEPVRLAETLAAAERFVGTRGGAMDQAVCLLAREGHAARCGFDPLRIEHVPVPSVWRFVVAFSGRRAEKSGAARDLYNRRSSESMEAVRAVRNALGDDAGAGGATFDHDTVVQGIGPADRRAVHRQAGAPLRELLQALGAAHLVEHARALLTAEALPRFRHVVSEGERVVRAVDALGREDAQAFGALMNASHASLRDDYGVSTGELDALTVLLNEAGATGARITGAGLGGCVVALCLEHQAERLIEALERRGPVATDAPDRAIHFIARPSNGARILPL